MRQLDVFRLVVEETSINRAAARLRLTQPAVSRKIIALEEELQLTLFERVGKKLILTRAGQVCYEYAVRIQTLEEEMLETARRIRSDSAPLNLTIGASLTTLQSSLPDLIAAYTAAFPTTEITAMTGKTHEIISLVTGNKVDIGLIASRVEHAGIRSTPLFDDHLALVLPALHPLLEQPAISISQLNRLPVILFSRGTWYRVMMDNLFEKHGVKPDVRMEIDSFEAILRLVSSLRAATLLPMSYLRTRMLEGNEVVLRQLPELVGAKRTTSLIYTEEAYRSAHIREFVRLARSLLDGRRT